MVLWVGWLVGGWVLWVGGWVGWMVGVSPAALAELRCVRLVLCRITMGLARSIHPPPNTNTTHTPNPKQVAELPIQLSTTALFAVVIYWMVGFQRDAGRFLNYLAAMVLTSLVGESYIRACVGSVCVFRVWGMDACACLFVWIHRVMGCVCLSVSVCIFVSYPMVGCIRLRRP